MACPELQNTVKAALNALYHHPDDSVRMQADRWLQDFQRTLDAWQVSDNLLHDSSSNLETLIFCSQTLRSKVQRDFEELPSEAFCPLRDSLYALLKKLANGPAKVRTQICLAVAALAVHVSAEDWGGGGILSWLGEEMNSHPEWILSFLELLTVLPQEAMSYRIAVRPERRRQFEKELISSMEIALSLLTVCLSLNELKEQILEAFASWLRLGHGIPALTLASHPLVHAALSELNSEQISEAAVNVVSELIHYTAAGRSGGLSAQMPLIQVLVPRVMSLKNQLKDSSKDEEDVKAIARLFSDMGDSYVELIAAGSEESMMIVHALLEVASHPEFDIASMTFYFWHSLQVNLTRRESHSLPESNPPSDAEKNRRLHIFRPAYELLVSLVCFQVQYPPNYQELSKEDRNDFDKTRLAIGEVLMDAAAVLGGDVTLRILFMKLVQAVGSCSSDESCQWQPAEASLYGIQAIASSVSVFEAELMPQVMALFPKLPRQPQLLQTACLTIGAYSKWLNAAQPELLSSIIETLTIGMSISEDSAASASLAFRHVCHDCSGKLCGSLDGLLHIYRLAVTGEGSYKLAEEDSLHLVEALSVVVAKLSPDQAKKALEILCLPVVNPLQDYVNLGSGPLQQVPARQLMIHIDRLANIFGHVNHPEAVADAVQRLWPMFKAIFDHRGWDMRTMESLCRACKYAVKTSGNLMGNTIGSMLEEIQGLYQLHHQPCFLYLSSEVIKKFGSDPSCASYLGSLIEALFSHTTHILRTIQDFTARPDIADDCFLLASRCIRYCPHIFIPSSIFPSLIDCAMIGITVQHREACKSILAFLSDVLLLANSKGGGPHGSIIDSVIFSRGSSLTRILIASLTGALPSSRVQEVTDVLISLTRSYGMKVLEWAKGSISLLPSTAVTEIEGSRFLNALVEAASGADPYTIMAPIEELSDVCRRNRTVQEIVQGALRPHDLNYAVVSS
ncbi:hypothetical protein H6P81_019295 [Aristolochia fimbriata]|uniref:ARM repeat superfamily protein n=1 Tax=Aristolochia fimbriata TaxID=158543 RepID=A0AAV7DRC1_ARIFI|nr:hypothetical protein H6P81_019295 [Aristolochia fimbriata]